MELDQQQLQILLQTQMVLLKSAMPVSIVLTLILTLLLVLSVDRPI